MPRKANAVAVARMTCLTTGCGQRIAVYQNVRHYLYTRCGSCGADQRNGEAHQVEVWQRCEPIDGAVIHRPPNVPESAGPIGGALTGAAPAAVIVEPVHVPKGEPVHVPAQEPVQETAKPAEKPADVPKGADAKKKKGGGAGWLLLGMLGVGAALLTAGASARNG